MCLRQLPSRRRRWQAAAGTALLLGLLCQEWQKGEAVLRVLRLGCSEGKADPPALSWKYPTMPWGSCSPFHSIGPFQPNFFLFLSLLLADISLPVHAPRFLCTALGSHLWRRQVPPGFQEAGGRVEERVCTLLQDAVCRAGAAGVAWRGGVRWLGWVQVWGSTRRALGSAVPGSPVPAQDSTGSLEWCWGMP